jgi:RHS repeat-associated protein
LGGAFAWVRETGPGPRNGSWAAKRVLEPLLGSISCYLEDRLGSVVGLANASQIVTDTFRYDAWGNLLQGQGTTNPSYQWVGEQGYYLNPDAGLYLLGYRYYAPGTGRFLTRDLIGFAGGINLYQYVGNNSINSTDPSGLWLPVAIAVACTGAVFCGGPGVGTCLAISNTPKEFVDCMAVFIGGLPGWHQCLCGAAVAACIAAAVAVGVKPIKPF